MGMLVYMWRRDSEGRKALQLIVPLVLCHTVLKDIHEGEVGGHLGEGKMLGQLKEREFYWPRVWE